MTILKNATYINLFHPTGKLWMSKQHNCCSHNDEYAFEFTDLPDLENDLLTITAHSLALNNRFSGQCLEPYSVLRHSAAIGTCLTETDQSHMIIFCGLMHDMSEAFFADIPRPFKIKDDTFREDGILRATPWKELHGPYPHTGIVKHWDNIALIVECEKFGHPQWGLSEILKERFEPTEDDLNLYRSIMESQLQLSDEEMKKLWIGACNNVKGSI